MDGLVDQGSRLFCSAAHAVGATTVEMQACGIGDNRYAIGLATSFGLLVLVMVTVWTVYARRAAG